MKQTVKLNYLRMAPRKVRAVAGLLRGVPVNEAEARLLFERRRPAKPLLKLLRSAITSAKTNQKANPDKLVIETITVDGGPMLKRSLPRARVAAADQRDRIVARQAAGAEHFDFAFCGHVRFSSC